MSDTEPEPESRMTRQKRRRKTPLRRRKTAPPEGSRVDLRRRRRRTAAERRRLLGLYVIAVIVAGAAVVGAWLVGTRLLGLGRAEQVPAHLILVTLTGSSGKPSAAALIVRESDDPSYAVHVIPPEMLLFGPQKQYVFAADSLADGALRADLERVIGTKVDAEYRFAATALADFAGEATLAVKLKRPVTITVAGEERAFDKTVNVSKGDLPGLFAPTAEGGYDAATVQEGVWQAVIDAAGKRPSGDRTAAADRFAAAASGSADPWHLSDGLRGLANGVGRATRLPSSSRVAEGQFAFVPDPDGIMAAITRKAAGFRSQYTVVIQNGSGKAGIGTLVADRLAVLNVNLAPVTNAERFDYARTRIVAGSGATQVAEEVRAILKHGVVLSGADVAANTIIVIVGRDLTPADLKAKDQQ